MFHHEPGIYRNQLPALLALHSELWERRSLELAELPSQFRAVYVRRVARTAAGIAAFAGMTVVFLCAAAAMIYHAFDIPRQMAFAIGAATLGVWGLALVAYGVARPIAARAFERRLELSAAPDLHSSITFLSHFDPRAIARAAVERWEQRALAWPLMGIALIAPLLIHYGVATLLSAQLAPLDQFGLWVGLSALIVGHVHYFVGSQGAAFAREVAESPDDRLPTLTGRGWRAVVVGVGTSLMPGLAALGIPCVVVAITGLAFLPATYWAMHIIAIRERDELAAAAAAIG